MTITIFYFSGTGNTWFIAKAIHDSLLEQNIATALLSIEEDSLWNSKKIRRIIEESDKIILGYPIYGSLAPDPMEQFIMSLPTINSHISISTFTTVALASGDGPIVYRDHLTKKGYQFQIGMEFIMNNNFNVPGFPNVLHVGSREKIEKRNTKALGKVKKMTAALLNNESIVQGDAFIWKLLGSTQRKHIDDLIGKINSNLYVEENQCVHCKQCIEFCPINNIDEFNNQIRINDHCIACMRCYHFCPTKAINITKASLNTAKWPRFDGPTDNYQKMLKRVKTKNNSI